MKSSIIIPFLCVIMAQYIRRGKISKKMLILIPLVVFIAYSLVDPFREEKNNNPTFEATSLTGIGKSIIQGQLRKFTKNSTKTEKIADELSKHIVPQEKDALFIIEVLSRVNLTYIASKGIEYADKTPVLPPGSPDFLLNAIEAPFGAYIPRFIWKTKALQNIGLWYTQVVLGQPYSFSSTAMGIFTNLYFTGGFLMVFLGFYIGGIVQRVMFFTLRPWVSAAGTIVYISLLNRFEVIAETLIQTILTDMFRVLPIMLILQRIIYVHRTNKN